MATTLMNTHDRARARRLREFLHECAGSAPCEEIDRVREAMVELGGAGAEASEPIDEAAVRCMLDCGAGTSAVLALMGADACFMLSRGPQSTCLASVVQNNGSEEAFAEGPTIALALLAAHVSAVLARLEKGDEVIEAQLVAGSMRLH